MEQKTEKKTYEEPKVTKVEFDFKEVITGSGCTVEVNLEYVEVGFSLCFD